MREWMVFREGGRRMEMTVEAVRGDGTNEEIDTSDDMAD
jgi:hypothetical protein